MCVKFVSVQRKNWTEGERKKVRQKENEDTKKRVESRLKKSKIIKLKGK